MVCRDAGAIFRWRGKTCLISKRRHFTGVPAVADRRRGQTSACMTGAIRRVGVADDSGVDAAGRKLGDAAGDVAVGRPGDLFRR